MKISILFLFITLLGPSFSFGQKQPVILTDYSGYSIILGINDVPFSEHYVSFLNLYKDTIEGVGFGYIYPPPDNFDSSLFVKIPQRSFTSKVSAGEIVLKVFPEDTVETVLLSVYGNDSITFYKALPVLIQNNTCKRIIIGSGSKIDIFLEAKSDNGLWYRVEELEDREYDYQVILPPGYVALTVGLLYAGDFETDLRYRLGENVSNTFRGTIKRKWIQ